MTSCGVRVLVCIASVVPIACADGDWLGVLTAVPNDSPAMISFLFLTALNLRIRQLYRGCEVCEQFRGNFYQDA